MPVKTSLKLVTSIGSDRADPERKLFDPIVHELDGTILVVFWEDPQSSHTCRIIDGCVWVPLDGLSIDIFPPQKLHIDLNLMSRNRFCLPFRMQRTLGSRLGQLAYAMGIQGSAHRGFCDLDPMITFQVILDPQGTHLILLSDF